MLDDDFFEIDEDLLNAAEFSQKISVENGNNAWIIAFILSCSNKFYLAQSHLAGAIAFNSEFANDLLFRRANG